ncbi:MAG: hypothetical protein KIT16_18645 [Rhodospirillaceae bacterium]|nr:hypothetical protein [Rhodospirillaceae bacterium]
MSREAPAAWPWPPSATGNGDPTAPELGRVFARCFGTADGQAVLQHLLDLTLRRALGPEAGDAQLRHLEGQRQLVVYVQSLAARGRAGG